MYSFFQLYFFFVHSKFLFWYVAHTLLRPSHTKDRKNTNNENRCTMAIWQHFYMDFSILFGMTYAEKRHYNRTYPIPILRHCIANTSSNSLVNLKIQILTRIFSENTFNDGGDTNQQWALLPPRRSESMYDGWITLKDNDLWTVSISLFTISSYI